MYKKISILLFSVLLNLEASSQLVKIEIDKKMIGKNSYDDIHVIYNKKMSHVYNHTKYIKIENKTGLAKKIYVLKNAYGLYEKPKLTYFNYIFSDETSIKMNLNTTISAFMIEIIGIGKIYNIGTIEAKQIINTYAQKFIDNLQVSINSDKDMENLLINKEKSLIKYAHKALVIIDEEIKINKTVKENYLELNEIEPLNTKMYINSSIRNIDNENFIYIK
jgi:hypothetical protein